VSNELGIGKPIVSRAHRDAIHVAVFPAVSTQEIQRGTYVRILNTKKDRNHDAQGRIQVCACDKRDALGIADPFLEMQVLPVGIGFWVFLLPGTATSLRHEYRHPELDGSEPQ